VKTSACGLSASACKRTTSVLLRRGVERFGSLFKPICNPTLLQTRFANVYVVGCNPALFANRELRNRYLHQIRKRLRTTYRFTHGQVCVTNTQYLMRPGLTVISGLKRIIWFEERLKGQNINTTAVQARHGSYRTGVGASGSHIIRIDHSRPFDTTRAVRVTVVFETPDLRANCWY
jgi:hypothetical protein